MLDESSPFVIKVPEGASHIDLGPILRPLIFSILKRGLTDPVAIERYIKDGDEALAYRELLPKINSALLINYLLQHDWVQADKNHVCVAFVREYDAKRPTYDRYGPNVRVHLEREDANHLLHRHNDTIGDIAQHDRKSKLEVTKEIIASANILDRIVAELGD